MSVGYAKNKYRDKIKRRIIMLRDVNFENIPSEKGDKETEKRLTEVYIMFEKEPEEESKLMNSNTEEENQEEVSEEIENIGEKNTDK